MIKFSHHYQSSGGTRRHEPLIAAALAEAERQSPALLEQTGAPAGSTITEPLRKNGEHSKRLRHL